MNWTNGHRALTLALGLFCCFCAILGASTAIGEASLDQLDRMTLMLSGIAGGVGITLIVFGCLAQTTCIRIVYMTDEEDDADGLD